MNEHLYVIIGTGAGGGTLLHRLAASQAGTAPSSGGIFVATKPNAFSQAPSGAA